jgi:hypothetical protein
LDGQTVGLSEDGRFYYSNLSVETFIRVGYAGRDEEVSRSIGAQAYNGAQASIWVPAGAYPRGVIALAISAKLERSAILKCVK